MKARYLVEKDWKGFIEGEIVIFDPEKGTIGNNFQVIAVTMKEVSVLVATGVLRLRSTF